MNEVCEISPYIRVAHLYRFPSDRNAEESMRIGYCYAWHLVVDGKGILTTEGRSYSLKKYDLVFLPPKQVHSFHSDAKQPLLTLNVYAELWTDQPQYTNRHIVWNHNDFDNQLLTYARQGTALDDIPTVLSLQHKNTLKDRFNQLVDQHQVQECLSHDIAISLLKAFILEIVLMRYDERIPDYRIQPIIERIDRDPSTASNYDEWMAESGLKKTQFHERFKQTTGLSPKAYWTKAMMKQAAVLLFESQRTITEIAADLNYSSVHHFTKQFKSYFGVAPSEYRSQKKSSSLFI
ncbi:helix-turn-helix transcriptional regulator [Bacillaceae bacterium SIJ1]|uniref:AraC family transcriptional regulator n=1 Tax=Litoribacterium kuwaitense TaxID=1398745 RepID=UPI0013EDAB35|nr:AraC family transcriptional regulator [Litoribacterium kuwaitense]NGP45609.1 helix-turn-helix transcriptional regulator [Litoribacterium kuwaitense]